MKGALATNSSTTIESSPHSFGRFRRGLSRIAEGAGTLEDIDNLAELADNMSGTSICALSDGAAMSFRSYVKKFRSEFEYHILHKKCDLEEKKTTVDA